MISKITAIIVALVTMISNLAGVLPSKQVLYTDVAYGTAARQSMDICFPANPDSTEGVVVYIHGGGWSTGDKSMYLKRIQNTTSAIGCITVTMNYRFVSNSVQCTDMLKDIDLALAKIRSMAETRGINCDKVMLVGASAGAQLALVYSYVRKDTAPIKPCAVAAYSAPADLSSDKFVKESSFLPQNEMITLLSQLTGTNLAKLTEAQRKSVLYKYSPLKYVTSACVPTLVVHGKLDTVVQVSIAQNFVAKLEQKGVTHKYVELPDSGHSLDNDSYLMEKSDRIFVDFVNMYLK